MEDSSCPSSGEWDTSGVLVFSCKLNVEEALMYILPVFMVQTDVIVTTYNAIPQPSASPKLDIKKNMKRAMAWEADTPLPWPAENSTQFFLCPLSKLVGRGPKIVVERERGGLSLTPTEWDPGVVNWEDLPPFYFFCSFLLLLVSARCLISVSTSVGGVRTPH